MVFWGIIGAVLMFVIGAFAAEYDSVFGALVTFALFIALCEYIWDIGLFAAIVGNPLLIIAVVVGYAAVGAAYATFWKWPEFIRENKNEINDSYSAWSDRAHRNNQPDSFDDFLMSSEYNFRVERHKARIANWIGMWPFSAGWDFSHKPVVWFWEFIYSGIGQYLQEVGMATARKIHKGK